MVVSTAAVANAPVEAADTLIAQPATSVTAPTANAESKAVATAGNDLSTSLDTKTNTPVNSSFITEGLDTGTNLPADANPAAFHSVGVTTTDVPSPTNAAPTRGANSFDASTKLTVGATSSFGSVPHNGTTTAADSSTRPVPIVATNSSSTTGASSLAAATKAIESSSSGIDATDETPADAKPSFEARGASHDTSTVGTSPSTEHDPPVEFNRDVPTVNPFEAATDALAAEALDATDGAFPSVADAIEAANFGSGIGPAVNSFDGSGVPGRGNGSGTVTPSGIDSNPSYTVDPTANRAGAASSGGGPGVHPPALESGSRPPAVNTLCREPHPFLMTENAKAYAQDPRMEGLTRY